MSMQTKQGHVLGGKRAKHEINVLSDCLIVYYTVVVRNRKGEAHFVKNLFKNNLMNKY